MNTKRHKINKNHQRDGVDIEAFTLEATNRKPENLKVYPFKSLKCS